MSISTGGVQSTVQCRVRFSHHQPAERLTVTVADHSQKGWVVWAFSDLTGNGKLLITSTLAGRTLAAASLTASYDAMILVAPGSAGGDETRGRFIAPVVDSFLNLWAGEKVQSLDLRLTSTLGDLSRARVEFALGDNLEDMYQLPLATTQLIPWPT